MYKHIKLLLAYFEQHSIEVFQNTCDGAYLVHGHDLEMLLTYALSKRHGHQLPPELRDPEESEDER